MCFFSREFDKTNAISAFENTDACYTKIVFLDDLDESILPYIHEPVFPGKVDICFCNPNRIGIREAIELHKINQIRDILIAPNCVYASSNPELSLGYEYWDNVWTPDAPHPYDNSARRVSDISDLVVRAGQIAESIAAANPGSDL